MRQPFGSVFRLTIAPSRSWLSVGPGWAALAGVLSTGRPEINLAGLLQLLSVWLLVDPIWGMLWESSAQQRWWHSFTQAQLPPPTRRGFYLPYAQPGSLAGQVVLQIRRYRQWWREYYWPERGHQLIAFGLGAGLALLISVSLTPTLFWLTMLALGLIVLAGQTQTNLTAVDGGRLQSLVQFLLPWVMGSVLHVNLSPLSLALAVCYWITYLGGLRMLGGHQRAELLFFLGQIAAILLLLAFHLLPGAAILGVLFVTQQLIKTKFSQPSEFLPKAQPYLVFSLLTGGLSLGSL